MQLILALDFDKQNNALNLVDKLDPSLCALKVGSEMFTLFGPDFVRLLVARGFKVFLDLKFHDIPNTVAQACRAGAELGVWMLNVHASGGIAMMQAAQKTIAELGDGARPLLIGVTVLTSTAGDSLQQVIGLAQLAKAAKLDGVVCSVWEAAQIKAHCGNDFLAVTPGIRLPENKVDDQARIATPLHALQAGSDFIVVGRPITQAEDPLKAVQQWVSYLHVD